MEQVREKMNEELLLRLGVKAFIDVRRVLDPNRFKKVRLKVRFRALGFYTR